MNDDTRTVIPIVEERPVVGKRETQSRVRVKTSTIERDQWVEDELRRESVSVKRVPVDRYVAAMPQARQEGETHIIPLVEEVLVVEKRLLLKEELHVTKTVEHETVREKVNIRHTEATVERE